MTIAYDVCQKALEPERCMKPVAIQNCSSNSNYGAESLVHAIDRDGFALLHGFLEAVELSEADRLVEAMIRDKYEPACSRPHNDLHLLRWNSPLVELFLGSTQRLQLLARALDAEHPKWISGYVSIKAARSPPLWWHQDWWCWDHPVSYQRTGAASCSLLPYGHD